MLMTTPFLRPDDGSAPLPMTVTAPSRDHLADERHDLARAHVERDEDCLPFHPYILA